MRPLYLVYHEIPGSNLTKGISFYKKKENLRKLGKSVKQWDSGETFGQIHLAIMLKGLKTVQTCTIIFSVDAWCLVYQLCHSGACGPLCRRHFALFRLTISQPYSIPHRQEWSTPPFVLRRRVNLQFSLVAAKFGVPYCCFSTEEAI